MIRPFTSYHRCHLLRAHSCKTVLDSVRHVCTHAAAFALRIATHVCASCERGSRREAGRKSMGRHLPYKPRNYAVGQTLLTLRSRTKLTQAELATLVGVNRRSIQHWENGEAYPKEDGLQRLIAVFLAQGVFTPGQ